MDDGKIEFLEKVGERNELYVCASDSSNVKYGVDRPFVISVRPKETSYSREEGMKVVPKLIIKAPSPFPFKDMNQVPWNYTASIDVQRGAEPQKDVGLQEKPGSEREMKSDIINEVGHFTRSGRCYSSGNPKAVENEKDIATKDGTGPEEIFGQDPPRKVNEPVTKARAEEFLRFLRHSEYSVVEQLHKQQARISILELLLSSEKHRDALLRVLNQTFVPDDISVGKLDRIVGHIAADNYITFSEDEIPGEGRGSTKALNITTHCKGYVLPGVLIDNGSALNVLPMATLQRLPVDSSHMKPCHNSVRAFDGTQRDVIGKIEIPLLVGPTEYNVEFVVMDIRPSYNCLLGRPWIHAAGAVPSSLHQKLKFVIEGKLVCVEAEQDVIASIMSDTPYIHTDEEAVECSFRALELVNIAFVAEGHNIPYPRLSNCTKMTIQETLGRGAQTGKGLGRNLQGCLRPKSVVGKKDRFGLGYKPNILQRTEEYKKREERRKARLTGGDIPWGPMKFPRLEKVFVFGGIVNPERGVQESLLEGDQLRDEEMICESFEEMSISMVSGNGDNEKVVGGIRPCLPGEVLNNWSYVDLPEMIGSRSKIPVISCMNDHQANPGVNFESPGVLKETRDEDDEVDGEIPNELLRLTEIEEKQIMPHQEDVEILNLGTSEDRKEVKIGTTLSEENKKDLVALLQEFRDVFAWTYQDMPGLSTDIVVHKLPIKPECKPVQQKLRRMRPDMLLKIKEEVKKQFEAGFLEVAKYPEWVANIVPVPKKDGKVRMCVDYRDLNKASPKDNFPLPHIDTLVDNTAGHAWFSFMDGFSGYNQIKMHPDDMEKTTFVTMWGTFCYKVMPFGLKNAGATYQRAMVTLFHDMMHKEMEVYVDDMIVKSQTENEHINNLRKLFQRLRKYQLKLNPAKCTFAVMSGKLLGFVVSRKGIEIDPDKVKAIRDLPSPSTQKEVRGFLGRLNYISRFISQLTERCDPVFKLLRKNKPGKWDDECQEALLKIKDYLSKAPILVAPVPGRPLILYLTIYERSMGCVLGQHDESGKKERAIYYLSKRFTDCETRYTLIQKTCCALVWVTKRLRQYLLYHTTWLISKLDPLKFLMEALALTGKMVRWQMLLSEFDIVYVSQKAIKGSIIADFLASRALNDYESLNFNFPDEDLMCVTTNDGGTSESKSWTLYFDGASNALGHGIGAVLISPDDVYYPFTSRLEFYCTNNIAEYEACVMGLLAAIERKIKRLKVFGDSSLVIYQLRGEWETRDPKLIKYYDLIQELVREFEVISFTYLPREDNQMADALATLAAMFKASMGATMKPIEMQAFERPAHCCSIEEEMDGNPWYHDILQYIKFHSYPKAANENDKKTIRRLAAGYVVDGEVLYKRSRDQVLLRCIDAQEAKNVLSEVHDGLCGTHANGFSMARKIMRYGYYWSTMERDCINYARKCYKCQIYADKKRSPPLPLHTMNSPWPFAVWGMDVIGQIYPKASNGHRFILVAIDYFTKWVEAASYVNITRVTVCKFLKKEIICRYGIPERIITDNASNLNNTMMTNLCKQFKIIHHNSTTYRPQMNGAVEAANKNIKKIIAKTTTTFRDWHEKLPFALFAYRTSIRTSTGATPYSLVYGMEAVLPIEIEIPSLRILKEAELDDAEWMQVRMDQLNLIEERRMKAICHGQMYQKRMMRAYNKKVRHREFREGDLVLKRISPAQRDHRGKWMPNWEGPYVVKKAFSGGALILTEMDGSTLSYSVARDKQKESDPISTKIEELSTTISRLHKKEETTLLTFKTNCDSMKFYIGGTRNRCSFRVLYREDLRLKNQGSSI
ncbi:hypothetical protein V6N13_048821 [Hibiscus sabdariffa]